MRRQAGGYEAVNRSPQRNAFTIVELLVVMAAIALLVGLLVPVLGTSAERAKVAKVKAELRELEIGLEAYHDDNKRYPPVRVSCNTQEKEHWCELPRELVETGYLVKDRRASMSSSLEDPFNPGHTYKYAAPGPYYLNGQLQQEGFAIYVPNDFPVCRSSDGAYHDSARSPLAWVVWSLGPRPSSDKALNALAPVSAHTWYNGVGDNGVIARIKPRQGAAFNTP